MTTHTMERLTFWPLPAHWPVVVAGYRQVSRPVAFSPDSRWLATSWADGRLRLWPLPGTLFAVGNEDNAWVVPLDGSPARKLPAYSKDTLLEGAAVSPTGRHVATAFGYGKGSKTLRVYDVGTGTVRLFDLPEPPPHPGSTPAAPTGYEAGISNLAFLDDATLYTAGHGGIRRWDLTSGAHELIRPLADQMSTMWMTSDRREILFYASNMREYTRVTSSGVIDIATMTVRSLEGVDTMASQAVASQGPAVAILGGDGSVRVGLRSGGEPHLLLGHVGATDYVVISPDLRWVASTGEDNTLRLWPMPDLSKPPLHTLPHDELLAKLRSLTNLRAVRDPKSSTGWTVELGPFPGWKNLPTW